MIQREKEEEKTGHRVEDGYEEEQIMAGRFQRLEQSETLPPSPRPQANSSLSVDKAST